MTYLKHCLSMKKTPKNQGPFSFSIISLLTYCLKLESSTVSRNSLYTFCINWKNRFDKITYTFGAQVGLYEKKVKISIILYVRTINCKHQGQGINLWLLWGWSLQLVRLSLSPLGFMYRISIRTAMITQ